MNAIKLCGVNLHSMYHALETKFSPQHFCIFLELIKHVHDALCLTRMELAYVILHFFFFFFLEVNYLCCIAQTLRFGL
jgi:hypothetical protein